MKKIWMVLVLGGCSTSFAPDGALVADAGSPEDAALMLDASPEDGGTDASPDGGAPDANEAPEDAGVLLAMDAGMVEDAAVADAATSDGGMAIDAAPDPPDGGALDDAGSDAGPVWVPGAMRPRPPVVYVGAPTECPMPSGPMLTPGVTNALYSSVVLMDRWMEPCRPGDVYGHSVPNSISEWCDGELRAATTCAELAQAVADCRSCGSAWVDTVIDAGCPLDEDLTTTVGVSMACSDIYAIRREGDCRAACPYDAPPPVAVAAWCHTWAEGALSCDDLYLSVQECHVCSELARELATP